MTLSDMHSKLEHDVAYQYSLEHDDAMNMVRVLRAYATAGIIECPLLFDTALALVATYGRTATAHG